MEQVHHKPVKRFTIDGVIQDEAALGRLKLEYVRLLTMEMRLNGYVVRLDLNPDFTIFYNSGKEYFEFILSLYGVYVGKKKSQCIVGIDEQKIVYTQKAKLKEPSLEVE